MIGNRLKLARSAAGLSLRGLSDRIDNSVSAQAIGKYERDEAMPRSGVLIALAESLDVSVDYLSGDPGISLRGVDFRSRRVTSRRDEDRIGATVIQKLERYLVIEEVLDMQSVYWDRPRLAPYPVISGIHEADRAASALRNEWGLGLNPIYDMAEMMEDHGAKVFFCPLEEGIDGLTAHVGRDNQPDARVIVVSQDVSRDRQRFTIAHEIGHMVLDVSPGIDREEATHRFAGAFLMPEEVLWAKIGKHRSDIDWREFLALKLSFGMSIQAITHRCRNLGIISQALSGRLFETFDRVGWRSPPYREPLDAQGSRIGRFERLCLRALAEGAISESRASELLGVSTQELNDEWRWLVS
ncbi:MAG: ImmA/IrrE family metallo-endopeptidase [Dehalococcoidia bacterium]|nr:ImmA/IrrE family metallo-endopeptidase [Dehalococcoidia bacterium]